MTVILRYATASQEVPLGPFVDELDGDTPETALTIANTDIKIWKSGGTTLSSKNSGGATHISNGIYYAVLDATDTNTLGPMCLYCNMSGALPVKQWCRVLTAEQYDAASTQLSASIVSTQRIWKFNAPTQTTSPTILRELAGSFDDLVCEMDMSHIIGPNNSVSTVVTNSWSAAAGGTAPTTVTASPSANGKGVTLILDGGSTTADTYTLSVTFTTSDGQSMKRKATMVLA